jgi:hypothetical protein
MDGEDNCRRRQTTSKGLNTRVRFDFRDLGRLVRAPAQVSFRLESRRGAANVNSKSKWVPCPAHALDILAAVALSYGAEVLAGFVGAPGIASVRSEMSKAGRLSDASAPECIGLQRHQRRLAD